MAGIKGMKRFSNTITEEVFRMKSEGKTNKQISELLGLNNRTVIKNLINRHNRKQRQIECGLSPKKRGRPPKNKLRTETQKDSLINQLQMENDLLRSFLSEVGRR